MDRYRWLFSRPQALCGCLHKNCIEKIKVSFTALSDEYVKGKHGERVQSLYHVRGQKTTMNPVEFLFLIRQCPWETAGTVFPPSVWAQSKIAETSRHYLAKSRPNICDVYWHIDFPWQLLAEGVRRMGPCVRVHGSSLGSRQHYAHQENEA